MSIVRQLQDYRLTTAEILYHLPDHPNLLQTFIWQDLDIAPRYPALHKFLDFWTREIEGSLEGVAGGWGVIDDNREGAEGGGFAFGMGVEEE